MGSTLTPAIFFGHGNPMHAVRRNRFTEAWTRIGEVVVPRPKAVLCISAHWYSAGPTAVTVSTSPRTIHDFGGFPDELFAVRYPAPGDPDLARRVQQLLSPQEVRLDEGDWGLDHGTWSVLKHVYPNADVPVVQLSIDASKPPQYHYDIGSRLATLREEGVLIAGSGNLVHNLRAYAWGREATAPPYDWALEFETRARDLLLAGHYSQLIDYERFGQAAKYSVPTPDHYLPLLYVLGAGLPGESVAFPVEGVEGGSISMLAVQVGGAQAIAVP